MAKKIKTGKGVYEQDRISYDLTDEADVTALREHLKSWANPDKTKNPFERCLPHLDEWIAKMEGLPDIDTGTPEEKLKARRINFELAEARKYITDEASACAAMHGYLLGRLLERMAIDAKHGKTLDIGQRKREILDPYRAPTVTNDDIRAVTESPDCPTRADQAKRLGIGVRQLQKRLKKMKPA